MINAKTNITLSATITIELTEAEARALDCIASNNPQQFINSNVLLYTYHETGIKTLFRGIREKVFPLLLKLDNRRSPLKEIKND